MSTNWKEKLSDRNHVAYDEAGHIVMAYILGRSIGRVIFQRNKRGTYNGRTEWSDPCSPPAIDGHVPYEQMRIPRPDGIMGTRVILAAGKAALTLWYQREGENERKATYGMADAKQILRALKRSGISPQERKKRFQDIEGLALQILSWPFCYVAVEQVAMFLRMKLRHAQDNELDYFTVEGATLQAIVAKVFATLAP